jgi:streptogramin lyase
MVGQNPNYGHRLALPGIGAFALLMTAACSDTPNPSASADPGATGIGGSAGASTGADASDDVSTAGFKLDVGDDGGQTGGAGDCPGPGGTPGEYEFSYIWISNSPEGTVSKVNTFTGEEEGRYRAGPGEPDPSRTSVNQFGDVAVANRGGNITKIAAQIDDCVDQNGDGSIQTSSGPTDVLAWGEDECVLWHVDLPAPADEKNVNGPRPLAWEPVDSKLCPVPEPRVWVGWYKGEDVDIGVFRRLDGATGATLDEVEVPLWDYGRSPRPYGGAVNADGDFWVTGYYGPAIRIDAETLDVDYYEPPPDSGFYGMAMDAENRLWIGGCDSALYHLDPAVGFVEKVADIEGRARGVQVDTEGRAWFAGNDPCRLIEVDTSTKTITAEIPLPNCDQPVGVSIDIEGYVWVVDQGAQVGYKVHPTTHAIEITVTGLVAPYTYSDMTGAGLSLVANPGVG